MTPPPCGTAVINPVDRHFMPDNEQQDAGGNQFLGRNPALGCLRENQGWDQFLPRPEAALLHHLGRGIM